MMKSDDYFSSMEDELDEAVRIAKKARGRGYDPSYDVEIDVAKDLADRVESLIGLAGLSERIRTLGEKMSREEVAFRIGEELSEEFHSEKGIEIAVRTAVAILTEGVVAAPIDGISDIKIERNDDGTNYLRIYYAGPIRSAGGSAQALSVLVADYIRRKVGINRYIPREEEIKRCLEEISLYKRIAHLQHTPSPEDVETIIRNCPVCIDGEPTEEEEVSSNRDIGRIKDNRIRGGMVLVISEGVSLKAPKIKKYVEKLNLDGWGWIDRLIRKGSGEKDTENKSTFLDDIIAGRPVFSHPMAKGGFRLRYGRGRNSGFATAGINPTTMLIFGETLAPGTQMKMDVPGKAAGVVPVDSIEGPTVRLLNGDVVRLDTYDDLISKGLDRKNILDQIDTILDVGEILINFGDFLENNRPLLPSSYCIEWWLLELENATMEDLQMKDYLKISGRYALELSRRYNIPLHPNFTYLWHDIEEDEYKKLVDAVKEFGELERERDILIISNLGIKGILEELLLEHKIRDGKIIIEDALPFLACLGLDDKLDDCKSKICKGDRKDVIEIIKERSGLVVRKKAPSRIGGRMGRPEKSKERKMSPPAHVLFPVGRESNRRSIQKAIDLSKDKNGRIRVKMGMRRCKKCGKKTVSIFCDCGGNTEAIKKDDVTETEVNIKKIYEDALAKLCEQDTVEVKGVKGLISKHKIPEPLEKGILRAKHNIYVFKDGTIRYDMTDLPITHFNSKEIGTPINKLRDLGYDKDYTGKSLKDEEQLIEIFPQDIIVSNDCGDYLAKIANYMDDLIEKFYGISPFYKIKDREGLIGELVIGLAPHTSAGVLGRIIGFIESSVCYAHPYFHAAKRRNCLPSETDILILNSGMPKILGIKEVYDSINAKEDLVDDYRTLEKKVNGLKTISFNQESNRFEERKIKSIIKTPFSRSHLIEIRTKSGRNFLASGDHRIIAYSNGELKAKKVIELTKDDKLIVPEKIDVREKDLDEIDVLKEFWSLELSNEMMVRDTRDFFKNLLNRLDGIKEASKKLKINKKTLSNYIYRDSIPLPLLKDIFRLCNEEFMSIPKNCKLGIKRDKTSIPRIIKVNKEFMRIMGYYLSEGYLREGDRCYQTNLAFSEEEMLEDYIINIKKIFGIDPYVGKNVLTISNKLVYHLFKDVLCTGENAHNKRVPTLFLALPKEKIKELLKAYFSGDGSVEKERLHVTCSSVNARLLRDIGFLLLRFGIFYRLREEKREASGSVKEFYLKKRLKCSNIEEPLPEFKSYSISIRSKYARKFYDEIGFSLSRKQRALKSVLSKEGKVRVEKFKNFILDGVKKIDISNIPSGHLYDIEVEEDHNFLMNDFILSSNCDGDEDCVMLLLDGLINFSKEYLPEGRGRLMDSPLVLTERIDPKEVDGEVHNMDICYRYPLDFYLSTLKCEDPKNIEMETIKDRLNTNSQYENLGFTQEVTDISEGPLMSSYKTLETMREKMELQLKIAKKTRAVDEDDVAERILKSHFIPDIIGNLRAFSTQKFRCVRCNAKFRRPPLSKTCPKCGGKIILTVHEASIKKYLGASYRILDEFKISGYTRQRIELLKMEIESLFKEDKDDLNVEDLGGQKELSDFVS
ncbi:MAG: DNA polymerase II large subunit [Candidatus Methanolliviera sp. GoM_asphalt]|nr:MAG: DNA polymerase II large subunit [Candidatus Methanolliviera sp. GoM_asphalt]